MTIKDKILDMVETDSVIKEIYEDENGFFRNMVVPALINDDSDESIKLDLLIVMLATQCKCYDMFLNNIAILGSKELNEKCRDDIKNIASIK